MRSRKQNENSVFPWRPSSLKSPCLKQIRNVSCIGSTGCRRENMTGRALTIMKWQKQRQKYLQKLREKHACKTRLMEVLDSLEGVPIIKKQAR